jgi:hypothetical protein
MWMLFINILKEQPTSEVKRKSFNTCARRIAKRSSETAIMWFQRGASSGAPILKVLVAVIQQMRAKRARILHLTSFVSQQVRFVNDV